MPHDPPLSLAATRSRFRETAREFPTSPSYQRLCPTIAGDDFLLGLVERRQPGQDPPFVLFAAVHYLLRLGAQRAIAACNAFDTRSTCDPSSPSSSLPRMPRGHSGETPPTSSEPSATPTPPGDTVVIFHVAVRMHFSADPVAAFDCAVDSLASRGHLFHVSLEPATALTTHSPRTRLGTASAGDSAATAAAADLVVFEHPAGDATAAKRSARPFWLYWGASTVSSAGDAVTAVALPLTAITVLHASALQVSLLPAATFSAWVLRSLPAGVECPRSRGHVWLGGVLLVDHCLGF